MHLFLVDLLLSLVSKYTPPSHFYTRHSINLKLQKSVFLFDFFVVCTDFMTHYVVCVVVDELKHEPSTRVCEHLYHQLSISLH